MNVVFHDSRNNTIVVSLTCQTKRTFRQQFDVNIFNNVLQLFEKVEVGLSKTFSGLGLASRFTHFITMSFHFSVFFSSFLPQLFSISGLICFLYGCLLVRPDLNIQSLKIHDYIDIVYIDIRMWSSSQTYHISIQSTDNYRVACLQCLPHLPVFRISN